MGRVKEIKWVGPVRYELQKYPMWWGIITFKITDDKEIRGCPHVGTEKYIRKLWKTIK